MHKYLLLILTIFLTAVISQTSFAQNKEDVFIGYTIPDDPNMMFYIQKNINPNTIVYALNLGADGKIDPKKPMEVFWRRYEKENGIKKELGWLEKTFAFDFKK